jgi:hypothetical protein
MVFLWIWSARTDLFFEVSLMGKISLKGYC